MADDTSVQEANDVGPSDATDTSTTGDSTPDFDSDDLFDDIDTSDAEEVDSDEEDEGTAATEPETDTEEETADDVESEDSDDTEKAPAEVSEDERKRHNDEMAKARIAEKKAREEAEAVKKAAEESNIQRYLEEAEGNETELERRTLDVEAYRIKQEKIQLNSEKLEAGIFRAISNIDVFKNATPAVQQRLLRAVDRFEEQNIVMEKGRPVEVKGDVFQYLQAEADAIQAEREELRQELMTRRSKDKQKQQTRTVTTPSRAPQKKTDEGQDAFDEEAGKY